MSGSRRRFALALVLLTLGAIGLVGVAAVALRLDLAPAQREAFDAMLREHGMLWLVLALLLPFLLGAALKAAFAAYPATARRLAEELRVIRTANPAHRIEPAGGAEMRELAAAINELADAHAALRSQVDARVEEANAHLQKEKNRLAALMSELAQSVLVCNAEGRILLYNAGAAQLLRSDGSSPLGLGRSIFGVLDKGPLVHALDSIAHRLEQRLADPVAQFVTARGGQLLRGRLAPVLDAQGTMDGFVLALEDITRMVEMDSRRDLLLQQLTEGTRASLANIRAAAETVQHYPDMDAQRRQRFNEVIRVEAESLSQRLDESLALGGEAVRAPWPLEDMRAADLLFSLRRNIEAALGMTVRDEGAEESFWLSVDSHSLVQALTQLAGRLAAACEPHELSLALVAEGRFARLTLGWRGQRLETALLHEWEGMPITLGAQGLAPSLREVLQRHGAELWSHFARDSGAQHLCLQLPTARPEQVALTPATLSSRPVYYDFDLFHQPGQTPELDQRPLAELSYTVFDTETTGLAPSGGDEIISIGAVRIVNARLLEQECFDRLVQPGRAVRRESQQVHGITAQMLDGQPRLEEVLPAFHRFAEDTVLVAHNAAFDMRFLQLASARSGVRFEQPVLDTLLLSALVHPGHPEAEHRLERIAERLGVRVVGRHTALGDAMVTGEVFLKLVPLLAERGIRTLREAREASMKTPYAKLEY
ncbi:MAG TPA: exonuclease domain-containing protein [Burkholderiaceae bacterium]|nr:exonuclease domain-containing protein [Burkholderiaceae bacterium]